MRLIYIDDTTCVYGIQCELSFLVPFAWMANKSVDLVLKTQQPVAEQWQFSSIRLGRFCV